MINGLNAEMLRSDHVLSDWNSINWKKTERRVKRLRTGIYQATKKEDMKEVRYLQKLLLNSFAAKVLAIKRITQINDGRKTPGIDGKVIDNHEDRVKIANEKIDFKSYKPLPVKRVHIPKSDDSLRPLGIPAIKDRIIQAIVKEALEPEWEARFEASSYGFRPGRCTQDALEDVHNALNNCVAGKNQWILDADIEKAFDTISHEFILNQIGDFPAKGLISKWLKAGYVEFGEIHETTMGTPQGGVISPLLANIALDGLQDHLGKGYRYVRYCDDFVIMAKTKQAIEEIKPKVEQWLSERGLKLKDEKTKIIHRDEGFNFLGFYIRMYNNGKLVTKPQKEKVKNLLDRIKLWLENNKQAKTEAIPEYFNPILRGWANYYRFAGSKKTFSGIQHKLWWIFLKWSKRRHPNKSVSWVLNKYFEKNKYGKFDVFKGLYRVNKVPIVRYVKVKGKASPDDPELKKYWENRKKKISKTLYAKGSKLYLIAENQNWRCDLCGNWLLNGEEIDNHHITPVSQGGSDEISNLRILHESCHYQKHTNGKGELKLRVA
jgi:RNA-directed DNA polymerase